MGGQLHPEVANRVEKLVLTAVIHCWGDFSQRPSGKMVRDRGAKKTTGHLGNLQEGYHPAHLTGETVRRSDVHTSGTIPSLGGKRPLLEEIDPHFQERGCNSRLRGSHG